MKLPPYEISDRPWFGPTRRAQESLRQREQVLPPADALRQLVIVMGEHAGQVQRVRFIDFRHRERGGFRFTIALTWTGASPSARDAVYDIGPEFVRRTGWYPLPQGERIGSMKSLRPVAQRLRRRAHPQFGVKGDLRRVSSAVSADGGCAIRVQTTRGSLLLDTGLPGKLQGPASDAMVLLSHVHLDHSGGIATGAVADVPIVTSATTAHSVLTAGLLSEDELVRRVVIAREEALLPIGQGVAVQAFPVPHCPGSTGFVLSDRTSALFFPGDVCLTTSRHDFLPDLLTRVAEHPARRKTVLLDATMAGRSEGASAATPSAAVRELLSSASDVVLCSRDASQLMYAYIDLFAKGKNHPATRTGVSYIMTARARPLMQLLHAAFIARSEKQVDPLLVAQYGKTMSAWAESRWLYWLDRLTETPADGARVWLVHPDELQDIAPASAPVAAWIGRRSDGDTDLSIAEAAIDTTPWTQHSDAATVGRAARQLSQHARVLLFHNFPKRLRKFIDTQELPRCAALDMEPVKL